MYTFNLFTEIQTRLLQQVLQKANNCKSLQCGVNIVHMVYLVYDFIYYTQPWAPEANVDWYGEILPSPLFPFPAPFPSP